MNHSALGARVRVLRKEKGLSQEELSKIAGISLSFLGHIERGSRAASLDTLVALCNALQVSPTNLLQDSLCDEALIELADTREELAEAITSSFLEKMKKWLR